MSGYEIGTLLAQQGPFVALLAFIILTGYKGVWVWGSHLAKAEQRHAGELAKLEDRCSRLEQIVFRQLNISETAVDKLSRTVSEQRRRGIALVETQTEEQ
jgi:hypothetical protein